MPRKRKEEADQEVPAGKLHSPHQRNAANARERSRMRVLSKAFSRLKTTLPWVPPDTKLSKLDTLRLASSYIAHLKQMLDHEDSMHTTGFIHPLNLTWPFTFNGRNFSTSYSSPSMNNSSSIVTSNSSDISSSCGSSLGSDSPQPGGAKMTSHMTAHH